MLKPISHIKWLHNNFQLVFFCFKFYSQILFANQNSTGHSRAPYKYAKEANQLNWIEHEEYILA